MYRLLFSPIDRGLQQIPIPLDVEVCDLSVEVYDTSNVTHQQPPPSRGVKPSCAGRGPCVSTALTYGAHKRRLRRAVESVLVKIAHPQFAAAINFVIMKTSNF